MDKKKISITVLGIVFLLFAVVAGTWILKSTQAEQREREEIAQIFRPYQSYGLIYNEQENRLYYGGELVRYFEDIVSSDYYLKWPNQNGTVDVYAQRNASGALTGVNPFGQQEFSDRTSSLQTATCELEISNTIDGYTSDVENMVKERIAEAYEVYRQYGLTYDRESDRLYYNGELVGYFEDQQIGHSFGPFEDSAIKIYAIRDKDGALTGLDVDLNNDDNPIEKITWEEITEDGVDEELLLRNLDTEVLTQVATELQTLVDEAIAEERGREIYIWTSN